MSPLTTTPTYQLAIKAPRSASPSRKSPECHPYITTSYANLRRLVQRRRPEKAIGPFNRPRRLLKGWNLFPLHPVYSEYEIIAPT